MSDKDFKVKNKLVLNGLTQTGPLVADSNKQVDATPYLTTLQGGTGTTTSPSSGQILYSSSGTTYAPTTLSSLDVKGATYSADAPSSPFVGQVWVESDSSSDSFDPNIIRRKSFTATAGQTVFTTDLEFIQGYEQVFFNGLLLLRNSDYTTASNTNVTLSSAAAAGDIVEVVSITNLNSINAATTTTNTFTGNQGVGGDPLFPIHQIGAVAPNVVSDTYFNTAGPAYLGRRARGTYSSPSAAQAGDGLNAFIARGYGTTGFGTNNVAAILLNAEENFTDISQPTYIAFGTTGSGAITRSERMRIASSGNVGIGTATPGQKLSINGSMDAIHEDGAGMGIRIRANSSNNRAGLQFTNNGSTADWGYIEANSTNSMVIRTTAGGTLPANYAWLGLNGGPVAIRDFNSAGGETSDWPVPSLSIASFDDYTHNTMLGLLLKDDENYILDYSKWNIKVSDTAGKTTSASTTNMHFGGPGAMILYAGNSEVMRITNSGNVGINASNPITKFQVSSQTENTNNLVAGTIDNSTSMFITNINRQYGLLFKVRSDGMGVIQNQRADGNGALYDLQLQPLGANILIGYTGSNGSYKLQVNSQIFATSSSIATSDGRYKENIETIISGLDIVDSLRPVAFDWKEHSVHNFPEGKTVGFIAQEVQEALAGYEWVDNIIKTNYNEEADEEFLGIAESNIIPLLVAAVKELKARVETLEAN